MASAPIDLLVTDVVMPGMRGTDLAARLAESDPDLPILFVSGYTGTGLDELAQERPGVGFLAKPFSPNQLADAVRQVLDTRPS